MSTLRIASCSRLLLLRRRVLSANHILHSPSPFPTTRNFSSSSGPNKYSNRNYKNYNNDDSDEEELGRRLEMVRQYRHSLLESIGEQLESDDDDDGITDSDDEYYLDSDSDEDDEEAEHKEELLLQKRTDQCHVLINSYKQLLKKGSLREALACLKKINKLEDKISNPRMEDRVIEELKDRLKVSQGKEKFLLQVKLNRALRMVENRKAFDPNNPANYGVIQDERAGFVDPEDDDQTNNQDEEEQVFDDMREKDTVLLQKLSELDKKLEMKLAELDHTFGKKGKLLEEEIRDLAEERNSLTEKKRQPLYRKGFDVKLIDVNRTCKVTKGGQIAKYTVMLACGNYNGAVGFAKAKGPAIPVALQKAYEKSFQNLHYIERHEEHTIAHAIQTSYKKTKVYLWPAPAQTGMKAGRTVQIILSLAGFKNVKSKVIGSRNPHNTVKAVFKALNAVETPKDVQEKFGRTVVESYLL